MPRKKEEPMDIMNIDILNPEFIALATEAKELHDKKEATTAEFKKLYVKHKADMAELEHEAEELKKKMAALTTEKASE